jgi:hypothetical protein
MLTPLDNELFPEDCRVVHMPLCDQWIFWIQKNGSSSLKEEQKLNGLKLYRNEEIKELQCVDIYIRDARSRYISGVNTFLGFLKRDHPDLDFKTSLWFAKKYKFLNRHYLPQFFWLLNLSRYLSPETRLRFHHFEDLAAILTIHKNPTRDPDHNFHRSLMEDNGDMELWFFVDQILKDLAGNSMTLPQLIDHYSIRHSATWNLITEKTLPLLHNVLR